MSSPFNKSASETDLPLTDVVLRTPNYVFRRAKRSREDLDICEQLDKFKEEMRKMVQQFSVNHGHEIQEMTATLKDIKQTNTNIENAISFVTGQNEELTKKITQLENQALKDKKYIKVLENKLEQIEIGSRKCNFVIKNVPRKNQESKDDLIEMIMTLSQNISCTVTKTDIKDIYRVRGSNTERQNNPIVVETSSTILKTDILKMGRAFNAKHQTKLCCKHLGFKTQEDTLIFLAEHLTAIGSRLHFLARDLIKKGAFKFCWTAYGKVYIRKNEQSPAIAITNEQQIQKLMSE